MKVLIIHNTYKFKGGEDSVVEQETELLSKNGVIVKLLIFDNETLPQNKFKLFSSSIFNNDSYQIVKDELILFKPDVIHIHNLFYAASPSILYAAKSLNIPVVVTIHNYRLICNSATLLRNGDICEKCITNKFPIYGVKNACFQDSKLKSAQLTLITGIHKLINSWETKIDKFIFLTDFAKQKNMTSSLKLKEKQCIIKPNFVPDYGDSDLKERSNSYLFVGRLSKEKGVHILIEAFKHLPYNLDIIGTGPLEENIANEIQYLPNVTLLGSKEKDEVISYMKTCKALIFPSTWYEGMPMTILEAYSCGTPVISSDINNINEIVINDKTGLHFKTGSSQSLSETIKKFESIDFEHLYKGARKEYEEKYTPQQNYLMLKDIYEKTISEYQHAVN